VHTRAKLRAKQDLAGFSAYFIASPALRLQGKRNGRKNSAEIVTTRRVGNHALTNFAAIWRKTKPKDAPMTTQIPADELSEIRAEIARLQHREAALCAAFLRDPEMGAQGRHSRVEVCSDVMIQFDRNLLPEHLRYDASFFRQTVVQTVRCRPLPAAPTPRPGWPIRRPAPLSVGAAMH